MQRQTFHGVGFNFRCLHLIKLLCLMGKISMQNAMPMPLMNKGKEKVLQTKCRCEEKQHQEESTKL